MSDEPRIAVVLVAAGSGTRLGYPVPKAFVECAGRTLLERSLESVLRLRRPAQIVIVAPPGLEAEAQDISRRVAGSVADAVTVVEGGFTRQESVARGLAVVAASVSTVLVHDAARALTPPSLFESVIEAVDVSGDGVIPGVAVVDTIKRVDEFGHARETVDRSTLRAVQTPQGFPAEDLRRAHDNATEEYTDDAALFSAAGHNVAVVPGDELAFKITTPWDLQRAERIVREQASASESRTGVGIDVHAFDPAADLWLAGLYWPDQPGLSGHSDGDAVSHAIVDALLSAAGLGDIGSIFGTDDPRFANARGEVFVSSAVEMLRRAGWSIENVAVQIVGNAPRFSPRRAEAEVTLTALVGAPVSVAATTSDSLGFTGRGEGVCAIATALIRRR